MIARKQLAEKKKKEQEIRDRRLQLARENENNGDADQKELNPGDESWSAAEVMRNGKALPEYHQPPRRTGEYGNLVCIVLLHVALFHCILRLSI